MFLILIYTDPYNSINFNPLLYAIVWIHHNLFSQSPVDTHFFFLFYNMRNNVAINILVQDSLCMWARLSLGNCQKMRFQDWRVWTRSVLYFAKLLSQVLVPIYSVWPTALQPYQNLMLSDLNIFINMKNVKWYLIDILMANSTITTKMSTFTYLLANQVSSSGNYQLVCFAYFSIELFVFF